MNSSSARLGDARRTHRLVRLVDQMTPHPGGTLPEKLSRPKDLKAIYRLMNQEEVTHAAVMDSHYEATRAAIAKHARKGCG